MCSEVLCKEKLDLVYILSGSLQPHDSHRFLRIIVVYFLLQGACSCNRQVKHTHNQFMLLTAVLLAVVSCLLLQTRSPCTCMNV